MDRRNEWDEKLPEVKGEVERALAAAGFEREGQDSWYDGYTWRRTDDVKASAKVRVDVTGRHYGSCGDNIKCVVRSGRSGALPTVTYMHGKNGLNIEKIVARVEEAARATASAKRSADASSKRYDELKGVVEEAAAKAGARSSVALVQHGQIEVNVRVKPEHLEGLLRYLADAGIVEREGGDGGN